MIESNKQQILYYYRKMADWANKGIEYCSSEYPIPIAIATGAGYLTNLTTLTAEFSLLQELSVHANLHGCSEFFGIDPNRGPLG